MIGGGHTADSISRFIDLSSNAWFIQAPSSPTTNGARHANQISFIAMIIMVMTVIVMITIVHLWTEESSHQTKFEPNALQ